MAELITYVERQKFDYTKSLFLEMGFSEAKAMVHVRLAYCSLVGESTIGGETQSNQVFNRKPYATSYFNLQK